ncbi:MAG: hypothetical protein CME16_01750 [Gemmatimonadetes bacterium]|nr:hypothetical protein [Gemmatimonadota bacterium]
MPVIISGEYTIVKLKINILLIFAFCFMAHAETVTETSGARDETIGTGAVIATAGDIDTGTAAERIRTTVEFMASLGSRISGYPGGDKAADFVMQQFQEIGLTDVVRERYQLTVPMDLEANLMVEGYAEPFELHGLWPNHVRTNTLAPEGMRATMIYGGHGHFSEFNGMELAGSIVVLEFNSSNNWLNAASLGAKAIIFIAPEATSWRQTNTKFLEAPLDLPRFWLDRKNGELLRTRLRERALKVHLKSRMDWVQRPAYNIWGVIPGRDPELKDENIIVEAYYDGISVVPALAPAAEMASSITALLELARHLQRNPPGRTIILAATGAHFLAQRGIVDFLDRHARTHPTYREQMELPLHPKLFISLDLSSQTDQLGIWNNTNSYDKKRFFVPFSRRFKGYAKEIAPMQGRAAEKAMVDGISPIKGLDWSTFVPGGVSVNSQVALQAGLVSLAFVTVHDGRFAVDSPLDLPELVKFDNLERQIDFINGIFSRAFGDPELFEDLEDFGPVLKDELRSMLVHVRSFPRKSQVPDRIVPGGIVALGAGATRKSGVGVKPHKGVRGTHFYLADDLGSAKIPGLALGAVPVVAYVLDPETGKILYAPDSSERAGKHHGKELAQAIRFAGEKKNLVVFPCISRPFYSLIDPRALGAIPKIDVYDNNGVAPKQFGLARGAGILEPVAVVFAAPDDSLIYLMGSSMMLTNSERDPEGTGYVVGRDNLERTGFLAVQDMWRLNDMRLQLMRKHSIENPRLSRLHATSKNLIEKAAAAEREKQWDKYMAYVRAAMGITSRAHPDVMGTLNDVIKGIVFFLALLIPAAFFGERLVFGSSDIRWQLAGFGLLLLLVWMVMSQVHPAFEIAHPMVVLLAFAIMAMACFVFGMISSRFNRFMSEYQAREAHIHETDISRISASYTAFMLGISNMRRRKLRTGLTMITLTLLTFTVLSFTSFRQKINFFAFPAAHEGTYEGTLIRHRGWNPLSLPTLDFALSHFGREGVVSPRNWYITQDKEQKKYIEIRYGDQSVNATGLLGLSPQEAQITRIDTTLLAGSFFENPDESSCLITDKMAGLLGLDQGDVGKAKVQVFGKDLLVRGIVDAASFGNLRDLDNEPLTPADFQLSSMQALGPTEKVKMTIEEDAKSPEVRPFVHLAPQNVLIIPYETLWAAGGTLRSVAVKFNEGVEGQLLLEDFLQRLALTLFAGLYDDEEKTIKVSSYTSFGATAVEGLGALMIPMFIAALIVLNAMLGAVYERFREISVYSSVGLAPMHIALLFIAEACVYAVVGVTLGYILGQGLGKILIGFGLVQGMDLNYSSMAAITSALLVMGVVLLSTIYPARIAALTSVPDMVRRWVPPPPEGDRWEFDFPFMVSEGEVLGLAGFLGNYFKSYSEESIGDFYAEKVRLVESQDGSRREFAVQMLLWLAPFDMGVSQYMQLDFVTGKAANIYTIEIFIQRISGQDTSWQRVNQRFMNSLRKEFLIWHTFAEESKDYHRQAAQRMIAESANEKLEESTT